MANPSPVESLVEAVRADLNARRASAVARVNRLSALLEQYLAASDEELARRFAATHTLGRPPSRTVSATAAAHALLEAVRELPELSPQPPVAAPEGPRDPPKSARQAEPDAIAPQSAPPATEDAWPDLTARSRTAPLVLVGGVPKPEKLAELPSTLRGSAEWIDTTRHGTHAIGNLERRIRDGRVAALVVLEGLVSHKHSEPLLSSARMSGVPCARAGKGGRLALRRALDEIESALRRGGGGRS